MLDKSLEIMLVQPLVNIAAGEHVGRIIGEYVSQVSCKHVGQTTGQYVGRVNGGLDSGITNKHFSKLTGGYVCRITFKHTC